MPPRRSPTRPLSTSPGLAAGPRLRLSVSRRNEGGGLLADGADAAHVDVYYESPDRQHRDDDPATGSFSESEWWRRASHDFARRTANAPAARRRSAGKRAGRPSEIRRAKAPGGPIGAVRRFSSDLPS